MNRKNRIEIPLNFTPQTFEKAIKEEYFDPLEDRFWIYIVTKSIPSCRTFENHPEKSIKNILDISKYCNEFWSHYNNKSIMLNDAKMYFNNKIKLSDLSIFKSSDDNRLKFIFDELAAENNVFAQHFLRVNTPILNILTPREKYTALIDAISLKDHDLRNNIINISNKWLNYEKTHEMLAWFDIDDENIKKDDKIKYAIEKIEKERGEPCIGNKRECVRRYFSSAPSFSENKRRLNAFKSNLNRTLKRRSKITTQANFEISHTAHTRIKKLAKKLHVSASELIDCAFVESEDEQLVNFFREAIRKREESPTI